MRKDQGLSTNHLTTTSLRAMRTTRTVALLAGLVLIAGCRQVSGEPHSTTELSDALLTVSDLGAEWQESQRDIFDERANENPVIDASTFCPEVVESVGVLDDLAGQAGADVEMRAKSTTRMMRLQAWDNEDSDRFFSKISDIVRTCDGTKWSDDAVGTSTTFDLIDGPSVGDESIHWIVTSSPPSDNPDGKFGGAGRTTVARFGNVTMVLQVGDFALDPTSVLMPEDDWRGLVLKAAAKIDEL